MAINQIANLGVKVDPRGAVTGANRAKRAITGIGNSARNVKNRIMSMQGALLGLGAGALIKSIITTASEVESLQVRLKFLTGSAEDSAKAFETMNEFAKKVPFSLEDIERASPLLLTVADSVDELNELLEITGDIAAVSGLSFDKTAEQLQRAFASGISSADLFRERGVAAFLGFEAGVSKTGKETQEIITKMFREGTTTAKGATEELKDTYQGQVSMMQDAFRELKLVIADAGVFELTAQVVEKLTDIFKDEKTLANMQKFGEAITSIGKAMGSVAQTLLGLPEWVLEFGIVIAFLGGKKARYAIGLVTAIALGVDAVTKAIEDFQNITPEDKLNDDLEQKEAGLEKVKNRLKELRLEYAEFVKKNGDDIAKMSSNNVIAFDTLLKEIKRYEDRIPVVEARIEEIVVALDKETVAVRNLKDEFRQLEGLHTISLLGADEIVSLESIEAELNAMMKSYREVVIEATKLPPVIDAIGSHMDKNSQHALAMADNIRKINEEIANAKEKQEEFATGLSDTIEDSIMRMTQGLMSFKDVVKSIFRQVASEMIRYNIARPLASSLSSIVTNMFGGAITGTSGVNVPPRANGGNVNAGQPYMVGERGAELFVPKSSGDIVPNNQIGGSTVINVTYSPQVNALDPRTAGQVIFENAPTIVGVVRQAFERNGQQVLL